MVRHVNLLDGQEICSLWKKERDTSSIYVIYDDIEVKGEAR